MRVRAAAAALILVVPGCGADERAGGDHSTAPVRAYVDRSFKGDMEGACAELSATAQRDLVGIQGSKVGMPEASRAADCRGTLLTLQSFGGLDAAHAGVMDREMARATHGERVRFERPRVDGATATVRVRGSAKSVRLRRSDGRWLIDRLDFTDVR